VLSLNGPVRFLEPLSSVETMRCVRFFCYRRWLLSGFVSGALPTLFAAGRPHTSGDHQRRKDIGIVLI